MPTSLLSPEQAQTKTAVKMTRRSRRRINLLLKDLLRIMTTWIHLFYRSKEPNTGNYTNRLHLGKY